MTGPGPSRLPEGPSAHDRRAHAQHVRQVRGHLGEVLARFTPPGPGTVLVCSDGLWNYVPEAADLAMLALPAALTSPLDAAAALVKVANDAGGRDNITAILVPFPLRTP